MGDKGNGTSDIMIIKIVKLLSTIIGVWLVDVTEDDSNEQYPVEQDESWSD